MEASPCAIGRRLNVCVRNKCWECSPEAHDVPEGCEFEILHALETEEWCADVRGFPRQSGKTKGLADYANHIVERGHPVYFVVMNGNAGRVLPHPPYDLDPRVLVFSQHEPVMRFLELPRGYLLVDELTPEELDRLELPFERHVLVAAWYTPR